MSLMESEWFTEIWKDQTAFSVRYSEKLFDRVSEFQRVEIFQTEGLGRVLILGGCFMVTEKDSFIYHEMLVHPAMSVLPARAQSSYHRRRRRWSGHRGNEIPGSGIGHAM